MKYSQVGESRETYAAGFTCHSCHGHWFGGVTTDPARPGEYPLLFRFCPCCGVAFEGQQERAEASERHRELRNEAGWASHHRVEEQKITYRVEAWAEHRPAWNREEFYSGMDSPRAAIEAWRNRLALGSWFGEQLRLVVRTPRGERVVKGPVTLAPNSHRDYKPGRGPFATEEDD